MKTITLPSRLFRISRIVDPTILTSWDHINAKEPGRWDDPLREYRVLYTTDNEVGAYVEVLQDLRQSASANDILENVMENGDFPSESPQHTLNDIVQERLRNRYIGSMIPCRPEDLIVEVEEPETRTSLESDPKISALLEARRIPLKRGDFTSGDLTIPHLASRVIFEAADGIYAGVAAQSAEHKTTTCFSFFETASQLGELRIQLVTHTSRLALSEQNAVKSAFDYLFKTAKV